MAKSKDNIKVDNAEDSSIPIDKRDASERIKIMLRSTPIIIDVVFVLITYKFFIGRLHGAMFFIVMSLCNLVFGAYLQYLFNNKYRAKVTEFLVKRIY